MFLKRRGSITVFICIVLAVLIPLSCILIDFSRYKMAEKQAKAAIKTCAESMLAAYDRQLREQYGLFALYPRDTEAMEEEIYELISQNLNVGASVEGFSDLYGFKVRKVEVVPFYNLSEPFVLQQQAAEFMKYRAPVQVVQEFYEKLKVMMGLMNEADMVEKKMGLDKLMNDIRGSLVKINYMLNEKLNAFNISPTDAKITLKDSNLKKIREYTQNSEKEIESANAEVTPINKAQDGYIALYDNYILAKKAYDSATDILNSVESRLNSKQEELNHEISEIKGQDNSQEQHENAALTDLKNDIVDLQEAYSHAENSFSMALQEYTELDNAIAPYRNELETRLPKVVKFLSLTIKNNTDSMYELNRLLKHITKHAQYHTDLIVIIDELTPQLNELDKESKTLQTDANNNDSNVSDRILGDISKQLKCIKKKTFTNIHTQLDMNYKKLSSWKQDITIYLTTLNQTSTDLKNVLATAESVIKEPQNKGMRYRGYGGYENVTTGLTILEPALSDLKSLAEMKGIYSIPAYELEPEPNKKEYDAFQKWFYKKYTALDSEIPSPPEDDTELKQIREGVGSFAKDVGQQGSGQSTKADETDQSGGEESEEGSDFSSLDKENRRENLPSIRGATSSDEALRQIVKAIGESIANRMVNVDSVIDFNTAAESSYDNSKDALDTVNESFFDRPVEGLDSVNENDKNFFDYEISRITGLANIIKSAVSDGIEGIIESLYMNEYIVSAFKNATTLNNELEHDIGVGRPLEETFLKNADVEYIIFGKEKETDNIGCSKRSVFAIRLVFNLLHVYTNSDKLATTLSLATSIAGWTIFGIPVVQNFLLISWAGLESYVDTEALLKGQNVPLIKTSSSWYLEANNLVDSLKNIFLKDIKKFASEQIEKKVDDISEGIRETVTGIIDGKVDKAFAQFEEGMNQALGNATEEIQDEVDSLIRSDLISSIDFNNMDSFTNSFETTMNDCIQGYSEKLKYFGQDKLAQFKSAFKEKIKTLIFDSSLYVGLVARVKSIGDNLVNKGISAAEGQSDKVFGKPGESRSNNITGRLIMMNYVDYLRLMLLAVSTDKKALRTADLMQLNMQEVSNNYDITMDQYNTYIFIKVELDMNTWFLPEELFKNEGAGMISVEWSQGY